MSVKSKESWKKTRNKRIASLIKVWNKHQRMTYLEKKFISLCKKYSLPFRYVGNGKFWITSCGAHINPDFIDTIGMRMVVEVYAKCWKQSSYEKTRGQLLKIAGFKTLFLDNVIMDCKNWEMICLTKIRNFLNPREG